MRWGFKEKPEPAWVTGLRILDGDWDETRVLIGRGGMKQDTASFTLEQMYQAFVKRYQSEMRREK